MSSFYRIRSASRSVHPGSRLSPERREMQRNKPALERTLARLRSAQGRMPTKQGGDWAEPAGISEGDEVWPVVDELLHDWVYDA